jgi:hypothetical protein
VKPVELSGTWRKYLKEKNECDLKQTVRTKISDTCIEA